MFLKSIFGCIYFYIHDVYNTYLYTYDVYRIYASEILLRNIQSNLIQKTFTILNII